MARLASQEKLEYYPTPIDQVKQIASWFVAPKATRIADPCVADGEALDTFQEELNQDVVTWGVELSPYRAKEAQKRIDVVLPASFFDVIWDPRSVSLMFNNPPYDWSHLIDPLSGRKIRFERLFTIRATAHLDVGGHQVLIIPRHQLADEAIARHITGYYERVIIRRFPGESYDAFKQVVVFCISKVDKYRNPSKAAMEAISVYAQDEETLSLFPLTYGDNSIVIPPTPKSGTKFYFVPRDLNTMRQLAAEASPLDSQEFANATFVRAPGSPINPAVPEKIGHVSMEISSGEVGNVLIGDKLAKGTITKIADKETQDHYNEDGEYTHSTVEERERLQTEISLLHSDGHTELITEREDVANFVTENATEIGNVLLQRNVPTYSWQPTAHEWETVSKTGMGLPLLPGRKEKGLFDIQKHLAIAATRVMKSYNHVILNAEMGFGKSPSSVGVAELLDEWPVLLVCPGHMLYKWQRIIEQSGDPREPIVVRIISRPIIGEATWYETEVIPFFQKYGYTIVQKDRYQIEPQRSNDTGRRIRVVVQAATNSEEGNLLKAVKSKFSFRGKGKRIEPKVTISNLGGLSIKFVDKDDYTIADFFTDYDAGRLGRKAVAISGIEPIKYAPGINDRPAYKIVKRRIYDDLIGASIIKPMAQCPECGMLYSLDKDKRGQSLIPHFCKAPADKHITGRYTDEDGIRRCGGAMFEMSRWRREGLARLVQRKYKFRFKLYIADEIHKSKGGKTDIGAADGRLCTSIKYGLALTGTIFGGNASSIFWLLYRRNPEVRKFYEYTDRTLWIDHYGLWERTWTEKIPRDGRRSLVTGIQRWKPRSKELPGISPGVIRYLLPITLFGKITDLGYQLPKLNERVDVLPMSDFQEEQYHRVDETLLKEAMRILKDPDIADPGGIAKWFTTIRYRPMSAFRNEIAQYVSKKTEMTEILLPMANVVTADDPWLPKEIKLAERVRENMLKGRKTLVFVEQTGTRDIRTRLVEALNALTPQARVRELSAGDMSPARREAWIKANTPEMDVLIVNPSLVETGLDLVMFADLVFYELPLSLYTLWQAMRRVWRLGQNVPVTCTFMVYQGTVEEALLKRMGIKLKAAMLLYGDEAAGAIIENDDSDLQREMIRAALQGVSYNDLAELDGGDLVTGLFSQGDEVEVIVSNSPMGSPIAQSPRMPVLEREPVVVMVDFEGPAQLSMFGDPVPASQLNRRRRR